MGRAAAQLPYMCIKWVRCMESRGAVLSAAGWGLQPHGLPWARLGRFCGNRGLPGDATLPWLGDVGKVPAWPAMSLQWPLPWGSHFGGVASESSPPGSGQSCLSPAPGAAASLGTQLALFCPRPALCSSPGAAASLPQAGAGGCGSQGMVLVPPGDCPPPALACSLGEEGGCVLSHCCCLGRGKQEEL